MGINFRNKKGLAFTFDIALGTGVIFGMVVLSVFLASRGSTGHLAEYQLSRIGSDILTVLDERESFDTLDHTLIEQKLDDVLPAHIDMLLRIEGSFAEGNGTIEVGGDLPTDKSLIPIRRVALASDSTYVKLTAYVWLK